MKFIFPQNYSFKSKFLGIIEYNVLILNIIWCAFVFCLINLIFTNLNLKIFIFVTFCLPVLLLSIFSFNHENIIFIFKPKSYLYCKKSRKMI